MKTVLGIDLEKKKFDVALLINGKYKTKVFENNPAGFSALLAWLTNNDVEKVHACMEVAGGHEETLARFLIENGHSVSMADPARIKKFGQSELQRTNSDKTDARLMACFCETMDPTPWQPPTETFGKEVSMDAVLQLEDDNSLLQAFIDDQEAAPAIYHPTIYWRVYQQRVIQYLKTSGLTDLRSLDNPDFIGFIPYDNGYRKEAYHTIGGIADLDDAQKHLLGSFVHSACMSPEMRVLPFGLSVADIELLAYDKADLYGRANGAVPPEAGWDSLAGNPCTHFLVNGKTYTYEWLRYYYIYAYFAQFVDFSSFDNIVEVGPGLGMQTEVIRKLHPHLRCYLLDNGAQAYICHQNMKAIFGEALLDYHTLRTDETITLTNPGEIAVLGNWQIGNVRPQGKTLLWACGTLCAMNMDCFASYEVFMRRQGVDALCLVEHVQGVNNDADSESLNSGLIVTRLEDLFECVGRDSLYTPLKRKVDSFGYAENICMVRRGEAAP